MSTVRYKYPNHLTSTVAATCYRVFVCCMYDIRYSVELNWRTNSFSQQIFLCISTFNRVALAVATSTGPRHKKPKNCLTTSFFHIDEIKWNSGTHGSLRCDAKVIKRGSGFLLLRDSCRLFVGISYAHMTPFIYGIYMLAIRRCYSQFALYCTFYCS